jgi:hypothetical protein
VATTTQELTFIAVGFTSESRFDDFADPGFWAGDFSCALRFPVPPLLEADKVVASDQQLETKQKTQQK